MEKYIPKPIDTNKIKLDDSLIDLTERLSHNIHEIWSKGRLEDGWMYGDKRNDDKKLHPCLISFSELPEKEKDFDRNSATETLKLILKLGYKIIPPTTLSLSEQDKLIIDYQFELISKSKSLSDLILVWHEHNQTLWQAEPDLYLQLGLSFLKTGEPLLAYDVFAKGLDCYPEPAFLSESDKYIYIHMCQQQALALSETGAVLEAAELLHAVADYTGAIDGETFGLLGRTYKEMALSEGVTQESKVEYFEKAYDYYFAAFSTALENNNDNDAYYNGINAATLALFRGNTELSKNLATQVSVICEKVISQCRRDSVKVMYWVEATLGEANLLKGDVDTAKLLYHSAIDKVGNDIRSQVSMQKQVRKILEHKNISDNYFSGIFKKTAVIVFAGHMIDATGIENERFPATYENFVREQIKSVLTNHQACIAYSSAACGSDIIFLEEVFEKGGEINIVLPYEIEAFKEQSVSFISDSNWGVRFDALIEKATRVIILTQYNADVSKATYDFSNRFIYGLALARSKMLDAKLKCISVWDGATNSKVGGTASVINLWMKNKESVTIIDPKKGLRILGHKEIEQKDTLIECKTKSYDADVTYYNFLPLLFADIKGYSKLNEKQLVIFSTVFLKYISQTLDKHASGIFSQHTQGDGLFIVFKSLIVAAQCANDIKVIIKKTDWTKYDLPENLTIRISLDAGPVYSYIEPVTRNLEFCGNYVIRAARMEPITPPGHIYASETFVAMANVEKIDEFSFAYAGQIALPKGHGVIPAYHMYKKQM